MTQNETPSVPTVQTQIVEVPVWKAISIVAGAILVSIVGTAFTVGAILNSDHFLLATTSAKVVALEAGKVDQKVYDVQQKAILDKLDEISDDIKDIKTDAKISSRSKGVTVAQKPIPTATPTAGQSAQLAPVNVSVTQGPSQSSSQTAPQPSPTAGPQPTMNPTPQPLPSITDTVTDIVKRVL